MRKKTIPELYPNLKCRRFNKAIALFLSIALLINGQLGYASPEAPKIYHSPDIKIPETLGTIDETFAGTSGHTVIYIQDAHDSLEAQENIAKLIQYLAASYGVKTVFEEGYEGPVPTEDYFGFIKDPSVREKVAYFLMDKLRIGGAEYAHINHPETKVNSEWLIEDGKNISKNRYLPMTIHHSPEFKLIGADSMKLHLQNIEQYKKSAAVQESVKNDLIEIKTEIEKLSQQRFPKELKDWMKLRKRLDDGEIQFPTYLERLKVPGTFDPKKYLEPFGVKQLLKEIEAFEENLPKQHLKDAKDQKIFEYYRQLNILLRLNEIKLTQAEYDITKNIFKDIKTRELANFIATSRKKAIALSRKWEDQLSEAIAFYEIAHARDAAIDRALSHQLWAVSHEKNKKTEDSRLKTDDAAASILVFGGFHKEGIKDILRRRGDAAVIVTPKITKLDPIHQAYYKKLMSDGYHDFEKALLPAHAAKPASVMQLGMRDEIRIIAEQIQLDPTIDSTLLTRELLKESRGVKAEGDLPSTLQPPASSVSSRPESRSQNQAKPPERFRVSTTFAMARLKILLDLYVKKGNELERGYNNRIENELAHLESKINEDIEGLKDSGKGPFLDSLAGEIQKKYPGSPWIVNWLERLQSAAGLANAIRATRTFSRFQIQPWQTLEINNLHLDEANSKFKIELQDIRKIGADKGEGSSEIEISITSPSKEMIFVSRSQWMNGRQSFVRAQDGSLNESKVEEELRGSTTQRGLQKTISTRGARKFTLFNTKTKEEVVIGIRAISDSEIEIEIEDADLREDTTFDTIDPSGARESKPIEVRPVLEKAKAKEEPKIQEKKSEFEMELEKFVEMAYENPSHTHLYHLPALLMGAKHENEKYVFSDLEKEAFKIADQWLGFSIEAFLSAQLPQEAIIKTIVPYAAILNRAIKALRAEKIYGLPDISKEASVETPLHDYIDQIRQGLRMAERNNQYQPMSISSAGLSGPGLDDDPNAAFSALQLLVLRGAGFGNRIQPEHLKIYEKLLWNASITPQVIENGNPIMVTYTNPVRKITAHELGGVHPPYVTVEFSHPAPNLGSRFLRFAVLQNPLTENPEPQEHTEAFLREGFIHQLDGAEGLKQLEINELTSLEDRVRILNRISTWMMQDRLLMQQPYFVFSGQDNAKRYAEFISHERTPDETLAIQQAVYLDRRNRELDAEIIEVGKNLGLIDSTSESGYEDSFASQARKAISRRQMIRTREVQSAEANRDVLALVKKDHPLTTLAAMILAVESFSTDLDSSFKTAGFVADDEAKNAAAAKNVMLLEETALSSYLIELRTLSLAANVTVLDQAIGKKANEHFPDEASGKEAAQEMRDIFKAEIYYRILHNLLKQNPKFKSRRAHFWKAFIDRAEIFWGADLSQTRIFQIFRKQHGSDELIDDRIGKALEDIILASKQRSVGTDLKEMLDYLYSHKRRIALDVDSGLSETNLGEKLNLKNMTAEALASQLDEFARNLKSSTLNLSERIHRKNQVMNDWKKVALDVLAVREHYEAGRFSEAVRMIGRYIDEQDQVLVSLDDFPGLAKAWIELRSGMKPAPVMSAQELKHGLRAYVKQVFSGQVPNNAVLTVSQKVVDRKWEVVSSGPARPLIGAVRIILPGEDEYLYPVMPTPHQLSNAQIKSSGAYRAPYSPKDVFENRKSSNALQQLLTKRKELLIKLENKASSGPITKEDLLAAIEQAEAVIAQKDDSGKTFADRMLMHEKENPAATVKVSSAVKTFVQRRFDTFRLFDRVVDEIESFADEKGDVSNRKIKEVLIRHKTEVAQHYELQASVAALLQQIPDEEIDKSTPLNEFAKALDIEKNMITDYFHFEMDFDQAPEGMFESVYYDAVKSAMMEELDGLKKSIAQNNDGNIFQQFLRVVTLITRHNDEVGLTQLFSEKAEPFSSSERKMFWPLWTNGVIFLNSEKKPMAWIPEVGSSSGMGEAAAATDLYRVKEKFHKHPGASGLVFIYPTRSGIPNTAQQVFFMAEAVRIKRMLPELSEVWLGTLDESGNLYLYRDKNNDLESEAMVKYHGQGLQHIEVISKIFAPINNYFSQWPELIEAPKGAAAGLPDADKYAARKQIAEVKRWMESRKKIKDAVSQPIASVLGPEIADELWGLIEPKVKTKVEALKKYNDHMKYVDMMRDLNVLSFEILVILQEELARMLYPFEEIYEPVVLEGYSNDWRPVLNFNPKAEAEKKARAEVEEKINSLLKQALEKHPKDYLEADGAVVNRATLENFIRQWAVGQATLNLPGLKKAWKAHIDNQKKVRAEIEKWRGILSGEIPTNMDEAQRVADEASRFIQQLEGEMKTEFASLFQGYSQRQKIAEVSHRLVAIEKKISGYGTLQDALEGIQIAQTEIGEIGFLIRDLEESGVSDTADAKAALQSLKDKIAKINELVTRAEAWGRNVDAYEVVNLANIGANQFSYDEALSGVNAIVKAYEDLKAVDREGLGALAQSIDEDTKSRYQAFAGQIINYLLQGLQDPQDGNEQGAIDRAREIAKIISPALMGEKDSELKSFDQIAQKMEKIAIILDRYAQYSADQEMTDPWLADVAEFLKEANPETNPSLLEGLDLEKYGAWKERLEMFRPIWEDVFKDSLNRLVDAKAVPENKKERVSWLKAKQQQLRDIQIKLKDNQIAGLIEAIEEISYKLQRHGFFIESGKSVVWSFQDGDIERGFEIKYLRQDPANGFIFETTAPKNWAMFSTKPSLFILSQPARSRYGQTWATPILREIEANRDGNQRRQIIVDQKSTNASPHANTLGLVSSDATDDLKTKQGGSDEFNAFINELPILFDVASDEATGIWLIPRSEYSQEILAVQRAEVRSNHVEGEGRKVESGGRSSQSPNDFRTSRGRDVPRSPQNLNGSGTSQDGLDDRRSEARSTHGELIQKIIEAKRQSEGERIEIDLGVDIEEVIEIFKTLGEIQNLPGEKFGLMDILPVQNGEVLNPVPIEGQKSLLVKEADYLVYAMNAGSKGLDPGTKNEETALGLEDYDESSERDYEESFHRVFFRNRNSPGYRVLEYPYAAAQIAGFLEAQNDQLYDFEMPWSFTLVWKPKAGRFDLERKFEIPPDGIKEKTRAEARPTIPVIAGQQKSFRTGRAEVHSNPVDLSTASGEQGKARSPQNLNGSGTSQDGLDAHRSEVRNQILSESQLMREKMTRFIFESISDREPDPEQYEYVDSIMPYRMLVAKNKRGKILGFAFGKKENENYHELLTQEGQEPDGFIYKSDEKGLRVTTYVNENEKRYKEDEFILGRVGNEYRLTVLAMGGADLGKTQAGVFSDWLPSYMLTDRTELAAVADILGPKLAAGIKRFLPKESRLVLAPGMGPEDVKTFWPSGDGTIQTREKVFGGLNHEGPDFAQIRFSDGRAQQFSTATPVPFLIQEKGKMKWVFQDNVRSTAIQLTNLQVSIGGKRQFVSDDPRVFNMTFDDQGNQAIPEGVSGEWIEIPGEDYRVAIIYSHLELSDWVKPGVDIGESDTRILGAIQPHRKYPDSPVVPHLHFAVMLIKESEIEKHPNLDYALINSKLGPEKSILYVNPLSLLKPEQRSELFVEGEEALPGFHSLALVADNRESGKKIRAQLAHTFLGIPIYANIPGTNIQADPNYLSLADLTIRLNGNEWLIEASSETKQHLDEVIAAGKLALSGTGLPDLIEQLKTIDLHLRNVSTARQGTRSEGRTNIGGRSTAEGGEMLPVPGTFGVNGARHPSKGSFLMNADELARLSPEMKEELFSTLYMNRDQIRMIVFNEHGQIAETPENRAILQLSRVTSEASYEKAEKKYGVAGSVSVLFVPQDDQLSLPGKPLLKGVRLKQLGIFVFAQRVINEGGKPLGISELAGIFDPPATMLADLVSSYLNQVVVAYSA